MARSFITSARAFPVVLAITVAVSLLPERWLGWTSLPGEIVSLPLAPFGHGLNRSAEWLRPPAPDGSQLTGTSLQEFEHLKEEYELTKRQLLIERDKVDKLREQLEQAQAVSDQMRDRPLAKSSASVVVRAPGAPFGQVVLNRGSNHGVNLETVGLYSGQLLGRVVDVSPMQCRLLPLANPDNTWITAVIASKDKPASNTGMKLQFQPREDGTLAADADKSLIIAAGDLALLLDPAWSQAAQGWKIGVVESVQIKDSDPLRNTIIVRPNYQVAAVTTVMLVTPDDSPGSGGGGAGGSS